MNFLTSIRGLAALLVVFYHIKHYLLPLAFLGVFYPLFADGYLAVDFFLVLSGFIISYKYAVDFKAGVSANYLDFMSRRLARIYPLHAFVMLCFLTLPIGLYVTGRGYDSSTFGVGSFLAKLFLVDLWWVGTPTWDNWNVPSWTISGELFAYLIFPLFVYVYQAVGTRLRWRCWRVLSPCSPACTAGLAAEVSALASVNWGCSAAWSSSCWASVSGSCSLKPGSSAPPFSRL